MADLFEALANPARRQILLLLREKDWSAGDIAEQLPLAKSTLSQHFNVLKATDLIHATRRGTTIMYSLNASVLEDGLTFLMQVMNLNTSKKEKRRWTPRSVSPGFSSRS